MTTNDERIVTHEDLDAIAVIERECSALTCEGRASDLLRRLRAAAEADQPPLPDGWYLIDGTRAYWQSGGRLYSTKNRLADCGSVEEERDRLTPLRPAVTDADIEKAARAARAAHFAADNWDTTPQYLRDRWMRTVRAALDTLGIEAQS